MTRKEAETLAIGHGCILPIGSIYDETRADPKAVALAMEAWNRGREHGRGDTVMLKPQHPQPEQS